MRPVGRASRRRPCQCWTRDASAVAALDAVTARYEARDKRVEILELNLASADLHQNLSGNLTTSH